jgi:dinuclear metal center YbgI/SA1388 family protein
VFDLPNLSRDFIVVSLFLKSLIKLMTTVSQIISFLHSIAPYDLQEDYDNSGLIIGQPDTIVTGILFCLDSTEEVIDEAIGLGANLIIAHHPIVFRGLKRFNYANYVEKTVIKAIKNDIAILSIHTNLDNVMGGVNSMIADKLGLTNTAILLEKKGMQNIGAGLVGKLATPLKMDHFVKLVKDKMEIQTIKSTHWCHEFVTTVAVCGGSGSFLINAAKKSEAQVYISADFKYHEFFDAENDIIIFDIGHYESEKFTIDLLYSLISKKFTNFAAHYTKINTNPVKYI